MPPASRITDMHVCPMVTPGVPPIPHVGGPQVLGAPTVFMCFLPAGTITSQEVCVGPPDVDLKCSATVLVCNKPADRMGDNSSHGGALVLGAPTIMIGG
ncbi:MAG: PAAR domain-containing protein [Maioricimonas sp. JB045]|uniref:PAAR domain-containing protein n=1 Tax=Maioricimonas sp. JC845 TaxID=3232138 RepID=UPI0034595F3F